MHLCAANWTNESLMGTNGVLLWVSLFSLSFTSPSHSGSLSCFLVSDASGPEFLFLVYFFSWNYKDRGKWGEMARLYLNWDSQSASCIIMRKDISIHTGLFLSLRTFVLLVRPNAFVSSVWPQRPGHCFPHTIFLFFKPRFYPKQLHNTPIFSPSPLLCRR